MVDALSLSGFHKISISISLTWQVLRKQGTIASNQSSIDRLPFCRWKPYPFLMQTVLLFVTFSPQNPDDLSVVRCPSWNPHCTSHPGIQNAINIFFPAAVSGLMWPGPSMYGQKCVFHVNEASSTGVSNPLFHKTLSTSWWLSFHPSASDRSQYWYIQWNSFQSSIASLGFYIWYSFHSNYRQRDTVST